MKTSNQVSEEEVFVPVVPNGKLWGQIFNAQGPERMNMELNAKY